MFLNSHRFLTFSHSISSVSLFLYAAAYFKKGEIDILKERTLVYMVFRDDYVGLRTISRTQKSPHRFYISRHKLEELEHKSEIVAYDIHSFAILRRNAYAGTLEIAFTWLGGDKNSLSGYQDTIILPYDEIVEHLHDSISEREPVVCKALSIDDSMRQARIVFKSRKNLHAALGNAAIRRKLIRFLRDQFRWGHSEKIEIYDDFMPYSFYFREIKNGNVGISGGIILHGQEDMEKAYYSMHT